jgi:sortase (surface protein transpeptidase)
MLRIKPNTLVTLARTASKQRVVPSAFKSFSTTSRTRDVEIPKIEQNSKYGDEKRRLIELLRDQEVQQELGSAIKNGYFNTKWEYRRGMPHHYYYGKGIGRAVLLLGVVFLIIYAFKDKKHHHRDWKEWKEMRKEWERRKAAERLDQITSTTEPAIVAKQ